MSRSVILGADARTDLDLRDPVCDDFFQLWQDTAENNANIYEQVGTEDKSMDCPVQGRMERAPATEPFSEGR